MKSSEYHEDRQREHMKAYDTRRREALAAIQKIHPSTDALPLAEVVALMPDHPEWNQYHVARGRRVR